MKKMTGQILVLYLTKKCETPDGIGLITGFNFMTGVVTVGGLSMAPDTEHEISSVKPILRPLSSLTEVEARELYELQNPGWYWSDEGSAVEHFFGGFDLDKDELLCGAKIWLKLLEWGFDLFGLIESGFAIDATKYEKT